MARLIVQHQDFSVATLEQLHALGVVDDVTLLQFDFQYRAPGQREAQDLVGFLEQATDYDVEVSRGPRRGLRREWTVSGRTQETPVSSEIINDWIRWMVLAGAQHGGCRFDGWGAFVPK